jgi:predicted PurR-regulated permease PerM
MAKAGKSSNNLPKRPPRPVPYDTPDQVSPNIRRMGGYAWRLLAIGLVLAGLFWLLEPLQTLVLALFFAFLIAAWLMPLTNGLSRAMPRWLAAILALIVFFIGVAGVIAFIGLSTISRWEGIGNAFRDGVESIDAWLRNGPIGLDDAGVLQLYDNLANFVRESGGDIALGVLSAAGSILGIATAGAAALFVLVFALIQPREMFKWLTSWLPARNREVIATSMRIGWLAFSQYSRGILLVAGSNAIIVTIVLIIMGVPFAIPLGVIVFFGTFIPYIGAPIAMFLAAFVAFVTNGPVAGLLVVVLIFVIGQIEGNVLQPLIMGHTVNLHPVSIVVVTAVAAAYFGLLGALIGVPVAAAFYGILKYVNERNGEGSDDGDSIESESDSRA